MGAAVVLQSASGYAADGGEFPTEHYAAHFWTSRLPQEDEEVQMLTA